MISVQSCYIRKDLIKVVNTIDMYCTVVHVTTYLGKISEAYTLQGIRYTFEPAIFNSLQILNTAEKTPA